MTNAVTMTNTTLREEYRGCRGTARCARGHVQRAPTSLNVEGIFARKQ